MPLTTIGDLIAGECTASIAQCVPGHPRPRHVTWRPGQVLHDSTAVTAALAVAAAPGPCPGNWIWLQASTRATELGQGVPQVITVAIRPPGTTSGTLPAGSQHGREAVGQ
jgi:hypothetical protein